MTWIKEEKLYPLITLLLIWIMAARLPLDTDMWWHLRAGEQTAANLAVYRVDDFSWTRSGSEWINHSWLSQVMMVGIYRLGGSAGLSIWVAACAVLSSLLVYLQIRKGHALLRSAVLLLAAVTASVVWSPRPQVNSLVLLALLTWLVSIYRRRNDWKILVWLVPLFTLWGNLHGGYVIGLIYLGAEWSGDFLDRILGSDQTGLEGGRSVWVLAGFIILCGLAVLINPFGIDMWRIPFNTVGVETLQDLINEWASPDFHQAFQQPMLWMLLGLLAVFASSRSPVKGKELIPVLVFTFLALTARRNFGPFAIISAPILARCLDEVLKDLLDKGRQKWPWLKRFLEAARRNNQQFSPVGKNWINLALIAGLSLAAVLKTIEVNDASLFREMEGKIFPAAAVNWIGQEAGSREIHLFNDYDWGGYLIFNLPQVPVFVDGRTDLFGDRILSDYVQVIKAGEGWRETLASYGVDTLLIKSDSTLAYVAQIEGWTAVYRDDTAVVLQER